jgi:hypothetical protein
LLNQGRELRGDGASFGDKSGLSNIGVGLANLTHLKSQAVTCGWM